MLLWINGSFGVGKTTISNELHKKIKESFIYDPEMAGENEIELLFLWPSKRSVNFYERQGFTNTNEIMELEL